MKLISIKKIKVTLQNVYDITVPTTAQFFADNILVHNCMEISIPSIPYTSAQDFYVKEESDGEVGFCSIGGINVARMLPFEYEKYAYCLVKTINILIDKAPMLTASMRHDIRKRRSLGIGMLGLADLLYKQDRLYADHEYIEEIAERHYYWLLKASQRLVEEGHYPAVEGIKTDWLPIDTKRSEKEPTMDWESLRGKSRANSVLVAHMPTETSSQFSNAYNGLYPARSTVIMKESRTGRVLFIGAPVKELAWDISNNVIAKMYQVVQGYTDQAVSADYYVVPNRYEDGKVPLSVLMKEWVYQARLGNKTMYYSNTLDNNGGLFKADDSAGCDSGGCTL